MSDRTSNQCDIPTGEEHERALREYMRLHHMKPDAPGWSWVAGYSAALRDQRLSPETTQHQVIQHVYTRAGRAAVCGIPGPDHDCDAMACSSVEHIIARVGHTVDEPPEKASEPFECRHNPSWCHGPNGTDPAYICVLCKTGAAQKTPALQTVVPCSQGGQSHLTMQGGTHCLTCGAEVPRTPANG